MMDVVRGPRPCLQRVKHNFMLARMLTGGVVVACLRRMSWRCRQQAGLGVMLRRREWRLVMLIWRRSAASYGALRALRVCAQAAARYRCGVRLVAAVARARARCAICGFRLFIDRRQRAVVSMDRAYSLLLARFCRIQIHMLLHWRRRRRPRRATKHISGAKPRQSKMKSGRRRHRIKSPHSPSTLCLTSVLTSVDDDCAADRRRELYRATHIAAMKSAAGIICKACYTCFRARRGVRLMTDEDACYKLTSAACFVVLAAHDGRWCGDGLHTWMKEVRGMADSTTRASQLFDQRACLQRLILANMERSRSFKCVLTCHATDCATALLWHLQAPTDTYNEWCCPYTLSRHRLCVAVDDREQAAFFATVVIKDMMLATYAALRVQAASAGLTDKFNSI